VIETLPPLSLYIHIPWCVRKCPYCDFNSHGVRGVLDEEGYVSALLADLSRDLDWVQGRALTSIFVGGGTPSLFSPAAVRRLLKGCRERLETGDALEVTMEANPGTLESDNFSGYRDAGVNRLSIGIQSFDAGCLRALDRIHSGEEALRAVQRAAAAGFERINLDLMFGLPGQTLEQARSDLLTALELDPGHISYYQLTLEPNTPFHHAPPALPDDELAWEIQEQGQSLLSEAAYGQYEISAHAREGQQCRHNLNYWTFGDYLGIGAGAHAKLTDSAGKIERLSKWRQPMDYLKRVETGVAIQSRRELTASDLVLEFMMNLLRLNRGFDPGLFETRTGLPFSALKPGLERACEKGLLIMDDGLIEVTPQGRQFLNDTLSLFMSD
jgi:oxygen-independent coproporphyrinogen-3 oxidase